MKELEMRKAYSTQGRDQLRTKFSLEQLLLNKWLDSPGLGCCPAADYYEHGNELSSSIVVIVP
jgi:hypothetical protein